MPSSTHPIFSYAKEKIDLNVIIKNSYKSFFDNFSYLTLILEDKKELIFKDEKEIEAFIKDNTSKKIKSFALSNDIFSFEFRLLIDSNLEVSFYFNSNKSSNRGKILKYVFDLLLLNKADFIYLSNLDDYFEDHYEIQEKISNFVSTNDYKNILEYIKDNKHYFCLISFRDKSLNVDNLSNDFKINIGDYLFLQNQKDKFI
jgi:hypothetical protein